MTNRFTQHKDILDRLVQETVACTPQEWTRGTLTIECDGTRIDYKLKNSTQPGAAGISNTLRSLIDELYVGMSQTGEAWSEALLEFQLEGESVTFKTSFKYVDAPTQTPMPKPLVKTKPRWKFW